MTDIIISAGFTIVIFACSFATSERMRKRVQKKAWSKALNQTSEEVLQEQRQWSKATEWAMRATNPAYYVVGLILVVSFFIAVCRGTQGVFFTHPAMLAANSVMAALLSLRAYHLRRLDMAMAKIQRHVEKMDSVASSLYLKQLHIPKEIIHGRLDRRS